MRLLHIDENEMYREGLGSLLKLHRPDWELISTASVKSALQVLDGETVHMVLTETGFSKQDLKALMTFLKSRKKPPVLVVLTSDTGLVSLRYYLERGVAGYLVKQSPVSDIIRGIESAASGGLWLDQPVLEALIDQFLHNSQPFVQARTEMLDILSPREKEVFFLLLSESSVSEIADTLFISQKTVENHRSSIYRKLVVGDRLELTRYARKNGLENLRRV